MWTYISYLWSCVFGTKVDDKALDVIGLKNVGSSVNEIKKYKILTKDKIFAYCIKIAFLL